MTALAGAGAPRWRRRLSINTLSGKEPDFTEVFDDSMRDVTLGGMTLSDIYCTVTNSKRFLVLEVP